MPNNGSNLEALVQKIEKQLIPEGFTVSLNQKAYEDGITVGEFDIVIEGAVGSVPSKHLIECRDRPSEGPQGRPWIQQLIGRREDFGFATVSAVSTTGFAESAVTLTKRQRIVLRTVKQASEIADGLQFMSFKLANPEIQPFGMLKIVPLNESDKAFLLTCPVFGPSSKVSFRELTSFQPATFSGFVLDNLPLGFDKESDGTRFCQIDVRRLVEINMNDQRMLAKEITVPIRFRKGLMGKTLVLRNYESENGIVGQEISVRFPTTGGMVEADFAIALKKETFSLDVLGVKMPGEERVSFPTRN